MPAAPSIETRIEAGALSIRFDGGYWNVLTHGATAVLSVEDLGVEPRAGRVTYRNAWGLVLKEAFELAAPRRLR